MLVTRLDLSKSITFLVEIQSEKMGQMSWAFQCFTTFLILMMAMEMKQHATFIQIIVRDRKLSWHIYLGGVLLDFITKLLSMITGCTTCQVDGCFGLIKQKYRQSDSDKIDHLVLVKESPSCNYAQAYHTSYVGSN